MGLSEAKPNDLSVKSILCWVSLRSTQPTRLIKEILTAQEVIENLVNGYQKVADSLA